MPIVLQYRSYSAEIDPTRGANCTKLRYANDQAILLREPPNNGEPDHPYLYGMPILYPVNRISGGQFEFEGRVYRFPINEPSTGCHLHGMLHDAVFDVAEQTEHSVTCVFQRPYLDFPHEFRLEIRYSLSDDGLTQCVKIVNLSGQNMPNFLGFHTTFNVPFLKGSTPQDVRVLCDVGEEIERNMRVYLPTGAVLPPDEVTKRLQNGTFSPLECKISRNYRAAAPGRIMMTDLRGGVTLAYETDQKFGWRLLYNGEADGGYICLEPMTCMANCQNAPFDRAFGGFDWIAPLEEKVYVSRIVLRKIAQTEALDK